MKAARGLVTAGQYCRLTVGVLSDEDAARLKKRPVILSLDQRVENVRAFRYADEVLPEAPTDELTAEFLDTHHIDLVVISKEYDTLQPRRYAVARERGIAKELPDTEGISTSAIIELVRGRPEVLHINTARPGAAGQRKS